MAPEGGAAMRTYRFVGHFNIGGVWSETAANESEFFWTWNKIRNNPTVVLDTIYGKDGYSIWNSADGFKHNAPKFCTGKSA